VCVCVCHSHINVTVDIVTFNVGKRGKLLKYLRTGTVRSCFIGNQRGY